MADAGIAATSTQGPNDMLPRALRKAGALPAGKAVVGRILSVAPRQLGAGNSQPSAAPEPPATTGKAAGKGKRPSKTKKGKKDKSNYSDTVLEIYLCGGTSGKDVLLFEAWDENVRVRLEPLALVGSVVRVTKCVVVPHTDKTKWFSTSRAPVYLKALPDTAFEPIADVPGFLAWHPVTPFPSVVALEPKTLLCVAGRVIPPAPVIAHVQLDGESDVPVASVTLRANDDVIKVGFWRDFATMAMDPLVRVGNIVLVSCVAKQYPGKDADPRRHAGLRAVTRTAISACPAELEKALENTPTTSDGAKIWSVESGQRRDYSNAKSEWMTLSVLDALLKTNHVRDIQQVFQIPSVHIEIEGLPTYMACSKCFKAWNDAAWPPCACYPAATAEARKPRWRGKLVLRDGSASIQATCFDAFEVVADAAESEMGEDRRADVARWSEEAHVARAMSYVGAVPFTILVTLGGDAWGTGMQATVQLAQKTFSPGNQQVEASVSHPMKVPVHLAPTEGACPPCELCDSSYDEALGLTVIGGIALNSFRALVKVADDPPETDDAEDAADVRVISCAFSSDKTYKVALRDDDAGARLRITPRDAHLHAVLSWDSPDELVFNAFVQVPGAFDKFKQFFRQEVLLHKDAIDAGPSFVPGLKDTPTKMLTAAQNTDATTPPAWKKRRSIA